MKKILLSFGVGVLLFASLMFISKSIHVSKSITLNAPLKLVKQQTIDFKNFIKWSPWSELDPTAKRSFQGEAMKVGSIYAWEGNDEVGTGTQELTFVSNDSAAIKLSFLKPYEAEGLVYFKYKTEGDNKVALTWGYNSEVPYIFYLTAGIEEMLGGFYEKGLKSLEALIEKEVEAAKLVEMQAALLNADSTSAMATP